MTTTVKQRTEIKYINRYSWKILYDPLEIGGFDKGTRFPTQDIIHMLRFHSLSLGTILYHHSLGRFVVIEPVGRHDSYCLSNSKYIGIITGGQKLKIERCKLFDNNSS